MSREELEEAETNLVRMMKENWSDKLLQKSSEIRSLDIDLDSSISNSEAMQKLLEEQKQLATIKKDNALTDVLSKDEEALVKRRIELQQRQLHLFEKQEKERKIRKINSIYESLTEEECWRAICSCEGREEEAATRLHSWDYVLELRKQIAQALPVPNQSSYRPRRASDDDEYGVSDADSDEEGETDLDSDDSMCGSAKRYKKKKKSRPKRPNIDEEKEEMGVIRHYKQKTHKVPKLKLNDAVEQMNMDNWSTARVKAWKGRKNNPNAYYYRFLDPNEKQKEGGWTKEEKQLFFKRMKEVGCNGQWGIFSMSIPGRVGYQCSNFYRKLIESGEVNDPNYVLIKGRACYLKGRGRGRKLLDEVDEKPSNNHRKRKTKPKRIRFGFSSSSDDELHDGYNNSSNSNSNNYYGISSPVPFASASAFESTSTDVEDHESSSDNPLPGYIDPITLEPVEKPALSPQGIVMSYTSWLRCLQQEPRDTCPITKAKVKRRDLIILTWDNIEQYRSRIKRV